MPERQNDRDSIIHRRSRSSSCGGGGGGAAQTSHYLSLATACSITALRFIRKKKKKKRKKKKRLFRSERINYISYFVARRRRGPSRMPGRGAVVSRNIWEIALRTLSLTLSFFMLSIYAN